MINIYVPITYVTWYYSKKEYRLLVAKNIHVYSFETSKFNYFSLF